ncbi:hypothetical protein HDE_00907 [Halotydeus destructor]|nr:hypothetical protein HDE_00907 [Halotydeus destructor]
MKLIVDVGYVFSPYVISHYPLCMSFSYRLEAEHYEDKEAAFVIEEENELTGKIKTIYQDSEVVSAWRTSNVTLDTVSLSVDKSQDKAKSFRIRLKVQSTKYNNYVRIKDVKVADGAGNAVLDKSNVNQSDFADYRDDFVCYNSTGFVGRHMLCDGVQDCPAAEDEFPEMCETNSTDKGIFCKPKNSPDKAFCFSDMSKMCDGTKTAKMGPTKTPTCVIR